jgi:F0F1-type ATP synthase assembly protein I
MLIALCVMGTLLGFSVAVNIVMFVAYGQQVKEIARMKVDDSRDKLRARIGADIEKSRQKLREECE